LGQHGLMVSAALALAAVERTAMADRDERVLERRASRVVRVAIAGDDRGDAELCRELAQPGVPPRVAALERPLQLDEEAIAAERRRGAGGRVRIADGEAVTGAAGEANEAVVPLEQRLERKLGR